MPQPLESLSRPALELRYRRMRLAVVVLSVISVLLIAVLGAQRIGDAGGAAHGVAPGAETTSGDSAAAPASCPVEDRRDADDPRAIGAVDAPIVLHEWTDFRCPYCGAFSRDTLPAIVAEYVDRGEVRIEIHDAALVGGDNSVLIAAAARAAGDQGRYFEFFSEVYDAMAGNPDSHPEYDIDGLAAVASRAGVPDLGRFRASIESGEYEAAVRAETEEAKRIGVSGVPFFTTSECGRVVSGAQPIEAFRAELDAALAERR